MPETAATLRVNVKLNDLTNRVKIINKCAYNKTTMVKMKVPIDGQYGLASIYRDDKFSRQVEIESIVLGDILKSFNTIKLVKIDVEGSELEVLEGMHLTLCNVNYIIIELTRNKKEVLNLLKCNGFNIKPLGHRCYFLLHASVST